MPLWKRQQEDVHILEMEGDFVIGRPMTRPLDLKGRPLDDLGEVIKELLQQGKAKILLDLEKVRFIDSSGLGELIACKKRTRERGGDIKLLRPTGQVKNLLVMTLLTGVFDVFEDEDVAVASFDAP